MQINKTKLLVIIIAFIIAIISCFFYINYSPKLIFNKISHFNFEEADISSARYVSSYDQGLLFTIEDADINPDDIINEMNLLVSNIDDYEFKYSKKIDLDDQSLISISFINGEDTIDIRIYGDLNTLADINMVQITLQNDRKNYHKSIEYIIEHDDLLVLYNMFYHE